MVFLKYVMVIKKRASNKSINFKQLWAINGGKFNPKYLPIWVQTDAIRAIHPNFRKISRWAAQRLSIKLTIGFTNSIGVRCTTWRCSEYEHICFIPIGLLIRLDYLLRILEREKGKKYIHIVDPDYYGDLPKPMKIARERLPSPEPIHTLVWDSIEPKEFWERLRVINEEDRQYSQLQDRKMQIDQLQLAIFFCALHESAHAIRRHYTILEDSSNLLFDKRGAELDADAMAGMWLSQFRHHELLKYIKKITPNKFIDLVAANAWQITFSVSLVIGLFDINRLALGSFLSDTYHHPSARLQFSTNGMFHGFKVFFKNNIIYDVLVPMSAFGAKAYMARITNAWLKYDPEGKCRRCTSLYFSMHNSNKNRKQSTSLYDLFMDASNEYVKFLKKHASILDRSLMNKK